MVDGELWHTLVASKRLLTGPRGLTGSKLLAFRFVGSCESLTDVYGAKTSVNDPGSTEELN